MSLTIIKVEQIKQTLKQLQTPPFFIIVSTATPIYLDLIVLEYQKNLEEKYQTSFQKKFELVSLSGNETTEEMLYSEMNTTNMFTPCKFIVVRHAEELVSKISTNKKSTYYFQNSIKNPLGSIYCIFHFSSNKIKKEILEFFQSSFSLFVEEKKIPDYQVSKELLKLVTEKKFQSNISTMELLAQKTNYQFNMANSMLLSLYTFCIDSKKITQENVHAVCFALEGDFFFKIIEHLVKREIQKAIKLILKHQSNKLHILQISMQKLWFNVIRFYTLKKSEISDTNLQKKLGVSSYYYKNIVLVLRHYSEQENIKILNLLFKQYENLQIAKNAKEQKEYIILFLLEII